MSNFDYKRKFQPCKWRACQKPNLMGEYCITHWYTSQGKECPTYEPKAQVVRPSIDRNIVITGKRDTSQGAAARVLPSTGTKRRRVYDAIMANMSNGLTCDEVCIETGMLVQSATSAIHTLCQDGWLQDSGMRRPTRTGVLATVWIAL